MTNQQLILILRNTQHLLEAALAQSESLLPKKLGQVRSATLRDGSQKDITYFPVMSPIWAVSVQLDQMIDTLSTLPRRDDSQEAERIGEAA